MPVGETGFEPATPASRTQCSTRLSYSPALHRDRRTGWDSNPRGLFTPHDFQSCALSHSATRPCGGRRGESRRLVQRRGWDSNPRGPFGPNGLAIRRLKPLGHLSGARHGGARSCPSWVRTRTLLIQSQACCQLHQGALWVATSPPERETGLEPAALSLGS